MYLSKSIFSFLVVFTIVFSSCKQPGCTDPIASNYNADADKEDDSCIYDNLNLQFNLKNNERAFSRYDTLNFNEGSFRVENITFYMSNITLNNTSISKNVKDVHLFRLDEPNTMNLEVTAPNGNYESVSFGLGLTPELNNTEPSDYPTDHPLGLNQNTYWPMLASSYIFVKIEGKMDTSQTSSFYPLTYHLSHEDLFRALDFPKSISLDENNTATLQFNIDLSKLFTDVDLSQELAHERTSSPLANQLITNFSNAIELE